VGEAEDDVERVCEVDIQWLGLVKEDAQNQDRWKSLTTGKCLLCIGVS